MAIEFHRLTIEDKPIVDKFFRNRYYENSHFNFTNLFMWREPYDIRLAVENSVMFMTSTWDNELKGLQPIGPEDKMEWAIDELIKYFAKQNTSLSIFGIEKSFAEVLKNYTAATFTVEADRNNYDYVYLSENLINLAGRKYHSKKNHLNSFHKSYPEAEYLPLTDELITGCKLELNGWYKKRSQDLPDDPFIGHEREAIIEVLNHFHDFSLKGAVIRLDNRIIAFTLGEQLNEDTAVIHVEKADPDVRGAYPAINQGFVAHEWAHLTYINREEDMGLEGLRKAKESYKPVKMIEKFNATLQA